MKLKEKMKRFWSMDVHNHEGFTLVELIIVIAILAILSSVAVAGYSAYIEKANVAADEALLYEINLAFQSACAENGLAPTDIDDAKFDVPTMALTTVEHSAEDDIIASFIEFFNVTGKFKVYTEVWFVNGVFTADKNALYAQIVFNSADIEKILGTTFGTMGVENLLGGVDLAAVVATGLLMGEKPDDRVMALLYDNEENWATIGKILGYDTESKEFESAYEQLIAQKMELMKNDPRYADIASDSTKLFEAAEYSILANTAVLSVAKTEFDTATFANQLASGTAKDEIKDNLAAGGNLNAGLSQAAMTYALYISYAQKNDIEVTEDAALNDVLAALDNQGFKDYIASDAGKADIAGYMAGLNMADTANDNVDVAYDILLNGYDTDELGSLLDGALGD